MSRSLLALLLLLLPASASAVDLSDVPGLSPEELADRLGLKGTPEAVILVQAAEDLDSLVVGLRSVVLAPLEDGGGFLRLIRGQVEGIVPLRVERGDVAWEGELRTLGGRVTVFDAEVALASPESFSKALQQARAGFDLFAFYDELDARPALADKQTHCDATAKALEPGPDRTLVRQACANLQETAAPEQVVTEVLPEGDLSEAMDAVYEEADTGVDPVLYRPDGTSRTAPRGTLPRVIGALGSLALSGALAGVAVEQERQAQLLVLDLLEAERQQDDRVAARHLFDARAFDQGRDAAIGVAAVAFATGVALFVWQGREDAAFRAARDTLVVGAAPTPHGAVVAMSLRFGAAR